MKKDYLNIIKKFSKINISLICKLNNVDRSNVLNGRASEETTKIVYNELQNQIMELIDEINKIERKIIC